MMVTCKGDSQAVAVPKMNSARTRKPSSSNSSGFRLLDRDHLESSSSVSRNSIYKLKIDLMFDDTSRSLRGNRLDDPHGSHRTRSIIMYGRSELASTTADSARSLTSLLQESSESAKVLAEAAKKDVQRISNSVQAQIEQLFTDVAKDATSSFEVKCLGSLPLKDKVTSLQGLQEPLRQLYLCEGTKELKLGTLDICASGLRVKLSYQRNTNNGNGNGNSNSNNNNSSSNNNNNNNNSGTNNTSIENDAQQHITPFHNIAVWSAVKFVISEEDGGAAFLPLITDPENIDKTALFQPLSTAEQQLVATSVHAPIFAVVMRSAGTPKLLECHGFICKSTEDAIVIAATLYQSLMAHVSTSSHRSTKRRTPRNQNGVSCISIASSSAMTSSNYHTRSQIVPSVSGRKSSFRSASGSVLSHAANGPMRSGRKKRVSNSSLSSSSNVINEAVETSTEERKRKSHKSKRAPPVPTTIPGSGLAYKTKGDLICSNGHISACGSGIGKPQPQRNHHQHHNKPRGLDNGYKAPPIMLNGGGGGGGMAAGAAIVAGAAPCSANGGGSGLRSETCGDILTRVAIPRSGSFLNTGGLTRYKSRAARRHSGKLGGGGGELFNEFRLHENLHSLDEILYAIIDADGMSFNDLKPIYKEFLMKLAVTLTQDELFQRSKNIMRRQKKKKQKRKASLSAAQKKPRNLLFGTKNLKKVFQLGQFRSCRGKPPKPSRNKEVEHKRKLGPPIVIGPPTCHAHHHAQQQHQHQQQQHQQQQRSRVATSGSDVSVVRHDNTFHGLNRNSSSGYVSCSECSYDSETCTCASADRCYCSLRTEQLNCKLRHKNERNMHKSSKSGKASKTTKPDNRHNNPNLYAGSSSNNNNNMNRHSLISCKSDDKCYCSMVEEEANTTIEEDSVNSHSDTTWCDTDSCVSASKCYCKRTERRQRALPGQQALSKGIAQQQQQQQQQQRLQIQRASSRKPTEKLGLDYELFTIGGNSKPVQPHEALSVKKSVEAAAVFADVKLSQTTDIKSLCTPADSLSHSHSHSRSQSQSQKSNARSNGSCRSYASSRRSTSYRKRESFSIDRANERNAIIAMSPKGSQKSCSADDLLNKLNAMERAAGGASGAGGGNGGGSGGGISISSAASKSRKSSYQSMRAVSASLEDTLGYLP